MIPAPHRPRTLSHPHPRCQPEFQAGPLALARPGPGLPSPFRAAGSAPRPDVESPEGAGLEGVTPPPRRETALQPKKYNKII